MSLENRLHYRIIEESPPRSGVVVPLFWMLYLHPRQALVERNFRQMVFMIAGHVGWMWLLCEHGEYSWAQSLGLHCASSWLAGMYLFGHFSLSHTFTEVVDRDSNPSWVRYATEHSVDIAVGNRVVDWVMGYLNYQVIHHLFPSRMFKNTI